MPNIELVIEGRDNSGGALQSAQSGISGIGQIAAGILSSQVFTKIASAVVDFGKDVIDKASGAQKVQAAFQAQLESTGHAADGTAAMVEKYANQILKTTTYDDEAAKSAATVLLGYKRIGQDVLPQAIQASADLAAKMGIDMPAAAQMVAKALGGDLAEDGIGKLNTAFKLFDKDQLKVVKDMAAAGNQAGAQKMILDALNKTVGGQAAAAGKTFEGSWQRIMNQVDNVKENLGGPLLDALAGVFDQFANTSAFDKFGEIATNVGKAIAGILPNFSQLASGELVPTQLQKFLDSFGIWWNKNGPAITAQGAKIQVALQEMATQISAKLQPFIDVQLKKFEVWFAENGPLIVKVITRIADGFIAALPFVVSFFDVALPLFDGLVTAILDLSTMYMQVFTGDIPGASKTAQKYINELVETGKKTIKNFINWVMTFFGTDLKKVTRVWQDNFAQMNQILDQIMLNIKTSISAKITEIEVFFAVGVAGWILKISSSVSRFTQAANSLLIGAKVAIAAKVSEIATDIVNGVTSWVNGIGTAIDRFRTAASNVIGAVKDAIVYKISEIYNSVANGVSGWISAIGNAAQDFYNNAYNAVTGAYNGISDRINDIRQKFTDAVSGWVSSVGQNINDFYNVGSSIVGKLMSGISDNIGSLGSYLQQAVINAINAALGAIGLPPIGSAANDTMSAFRPSRSVMASATMGGGGSISNNTSSRRETFYNFGTVNNGPAYSGGNSKLDRFRR